jgi:hypothetical protein
MMSPSMVDPAATMAVVVVLVTAAALVPIAIPGADNISINLTLEM